MDSSKEVSPSPAPAGPSPESTGDTRWMLIAFPLFSIVLFASWIIPGTRTLWDSLDKQVFYALNTTLNWGGLWVEFWAFANTRIFDLVTAICFALLCGWYCLEKHGTHAPERIAKLLLVIIAMLMVRAILTGVMDSISFKRESPTRIFEGVLMLSQLSELVNYPK